VVEFGEHVWRSLHGDGVGSVHRCSRSNGYDCLWRRRDAAGIVVVPDGDDLDGADKRVEVSLPATSQ